MQSAGSCLEGKSAIPVEVGPQAWLLNWFWEQIHLATKQFADLPLKANKPNEVDPCLAVEFRGEIDVAVGSFVATCDGAEQTQAPNSGCPQFRLMCPEGRDYVVRNGTRSGSRHQFAHDYQPPLAVSIARIVQDRRFLRDRKRGDLREGPPAGQFRRWESATPAGGSIAEMPRWRGSPWAD
jgi:hypothetical protein